MPMIERTHPGDVDVVIVTYNNESHLEGAIAAVRAWERVGKVVVVDNHSTDHSADLAESLTDVVVRMTENVGYGNAQNRGRAETTAATVLLLNPDARVEPAALEAGYQLLAGSSDIAAVEGAVMRESDGEEERWQGPAPGLADLVARLLQLRRVLGEDRLKALAPLVGAGYFSERRITDQRDVDFLAAVAPLVRRRALDDVEGFDPGYFLYAEDVDLCRRLQDAGWRLVAIPDLWATHQGGASSIGAEGTRRRLWWESHRRLVDHHWTGARKCAGLALASTGLALARREEGRVAGSRR